MSESLTSTTAFEWDDGTSLQGFVQTSSRGEALFTARGLFLIREETLLLADAIFTLQRGHCYGVAGENGCGKSTLLRSLHRVITRQSSGAVRAVYVGQDDAERAAAVSATVLEHCMRGDTRVTALQSELAALEAADDDVSSDALAATAERMAAVLSELDELGAGDAEGRARASLSEVSFPEPLLHARVDTLSGGWRTRLELARALFSEADVLMLDEPTNHLDLRATLRLAGLIRRRVAAGATVLLVSHDAAFLDLVCTDVLSLHGGTIMAVAGNYGAFEDRAAEMRTRAERLYAGRERAEERAAESAERRVAAARRAGDDKGIKQAVSRERRAVARAGLYRDDGKRFKLRSLATLDLSALRLPSRATPVLSHKSVTIALPEYADAGSLPRPGDTLCSIDAASVSYPGAPPILQDVTLSICAGDRVGLVGENGSGKSTLMQALAGRLAFRQAGGEIQPATRASARVVLVDQNHLAALAQAENDSALEYITARHPSLFRDALSARAHLARFGLGGSELPLQPLGTLSGGLRVRVMLADAFAGRSPPDILLLDEPTNHLDAETITALAAALEGFPGAVITVSHNCAFLLGLCKDLWVVGPPPPSAPTPARTRGGKSSKKQPAARGAAMPVRATAGTGAADQPFTVTVLRGGEGRADFLSNFSAFAASLVAPSERPLLTSMLEVRFMRHAHVARPVSDLVTLVV